MTGVTAMMAAGAHSRSRRNSVTVTLSSNTTNYTLSTAQIPGYVAGSTDVTLVINNGIYVYSTNTANAGLTIAALNADDTVTIINNGFIMGMGGQGGGWGATGTQGSNGRAAGPALTINRNVSITNNGAIAGGGGGGGGQLTHQYGDPETRPETYYEFSGGGGAGGGKGGSDWDSNLGGNGGGPGASGSNGTEYWQQSYPTDYLFRGGGGGGRIIPGIGGASGTNSSFPGKGGGAGGGGSAFNPTATGGSGNSAGGSTPINDQGGGGGGGWGQPGGAAGRSTDSSGVLLRAIGGLGGKAVNLNGFTVTWLAIGTRYGGIS